MSAILKNDAACRVIARLVRERDEARSMMHSQRIALAQAQQTVAPAAAAAIEGEPPMIVFTAPLDITTGVSYLVCIHRAPDACIVFESTRPAGLVYCDFYKVDKDSSEHRRVVYTFAALLMQ